MAVNILPTHQVGTSLHLVNKHQRSIRNLRLVWSWNTSNHAALVTYLENEMRIAKLSTDRIVLCLSEPKTVSFADGLHVLVSNVITTNPRRLDPYWVMQSLVVWVIEFGE